MEPYVSDERVAALEAHRENDQATLQDMSGKLDTVAEDVQTIKLYLEKQKGFIAGCLFILLPLWSVITGLAIAAWNWWKDQ
jgi:hypothetical protein